MLLAWLCWRLCLCVCECPWPAPAPPTCLPCALLCVSPPAAFMLSTQLNPMAEDNRLAPNCLCQLKRNVTNVLKDGRYAGCAHTRVHAHVRRSHTWAHALRHACAYIVRSRSECSGTLLCPLMAWLLCCSRRVVVILDMDVVTPAEEVGCKIGEPTPYTEGQGSNVCSDAHEQHIIDGL